MPKVTSVDHISLKVSDFEKSKKFYDRVMTFLGFKTLDEFPKTKGYSNGKTRLWISEADKKGRKHKHHIGDIGFHHHAFRLGSRKEVDQLQKFLEKMKATIVDPAGEYYDNYYGVYFNDPDGLKIEGMYYGR